MSWRIVLGALCFIGSQVTFVLIVRQLFSFKPPRPSTRAKGKGKK